MYADINIESGKKKISACYFKLGSTLEYCLYYNFEQYMTYHINHNNVNYVSS